MAIRNRGYDAGILPIVNTGVPVISVGNLTVGGTGKTPMIEYLVRYCGSRRTKVAVVSRGYKRKTQGLVVVSDGVRMRCGAQEGGDEPVQIAEKFPDTIVVADEKKARGAVHAVKTYGAGVILLDDGFQHRSLARGLDILMISGTSSLEGSLLLPAGMLREPVGSSRRAHMAIVSEGEFAETNRAALRKVASIPCASIAFAVSGVRNFVTSELKNAGCMRGKRCLAFCGIAQPESFRKTIDSMGLEILDMVVFPDHHSFTRSDMRELENRMTDAVDVLLTTEKDITRLRAFERLPAELSEKLWHVEIEVEFLTGEEDLHALLKSTIGHGA